MGVDVPLARPSLSVLQAVYVLIEVGGDLRASHPELADVRRAINGVQLRLEDIGTARRREAWKDSDAARNVVGFIDILSVEDPEKEPLLAWLCLVVGTLAWFDSENYGA